MGCPWAPEPAFPNAPLGSKERENRLSNNQLKFNRKPQNKNQWFPVSQGAEGQLSISAPQPAPGLALPTYTETRRLTASTCLRTYTNHTHSNTRGHIFIQLRHTSEQKPTDTHVHKARNGTFTGSQVHRYLDTSTQ